MEPRLNLRACALPLLALASLALAATSGLADTRQLFGNLDGTPVQLETYSHEVKNAKPGDVFRFSDGKEIKIGRLIGSGGTARIYEIADEPGRVLRIPKDYGYFDFNPAGPAYSRHYTDFIDYTIEGVEPMKRAGVPMIEVFEHSPKEYVIVERLPAQAVRLDQFIERRWKNNTPEVEQQMIQDLLEFARKTALLRSIGDFKAEQIAYVPGRGWVVFDWTNGVSTLDLSRNPERALASRNIWDDVLPHYLAVTRSKPGATEPRGWKPKLALFKERPQDWFAPIANQIEYAVWTKRREALPGTGFSASPPCLAPRLKEELSPVTPLFQRVFRRPGPSDPAHPALPAQSRPSRRRS